MLLQSDLRYHRFSQRRRALSARKPGLTALTLEFTSSFNKPYNSHSRYQDIIHSVDIGNVFRLPFILILLVPSHR